MRWKESIKVLGHRIGAIGERLPAFFEDTGGPMLLRVASGALGRRYEKTIGAVTMRAGVAAIVTNAE